MEIKAQEREREAMSFSVVLIQSIYAELVVVEFSRVGRQAVPGHFG
jgi:hypothetical protein